MNKPTPPEGDRQPREAAPEPSPADSATDSPRPSLRQTVALILIVYAGLAATAAFLQWIIGQSLGLHLMALLIAGAFTLAVLLDHLASREFFPPKR